MGKDVKSVTVKELCSQVGISRQGFYKARREKIKQDLNELGLIKGVLRGSVHEFLSLLFSNKGNFI